jgi:hypothetical protein
MKRTATAATAHPLRRVPEHGWERIAPIEHGVPFARACPRNFWSKAHQRSSAPTPPAIVVLKDVLLNKALSGKDVEREIHGNWNDPFPSVFICGQLCFFALQI